MGKVIEFPQRPADARAARRGSTQELHKVWVERGLDLREYLTSLPREEWSTAELLDMLLPMLAFWNEHALGWVRTPKYAKWSQDAAKCTIEPNRMELVRVVFEAGFEAVEVRDPKQWTAHFVISVLPEGTYFVGRRALSKDRYRISTNDDLDP